MKLETAVASIRDIDRKAMEDSQKRWDNIAKPLKSLGLLEKNIVQIAGICGSSKVNLDKKCVIAMCADNGVVAQGVTQTDSEITAIVSENFATGRTSVCAMARTVGADVIPVDIGVKRDLSEPAIIRRKIMYGTNDMTEMPAMTREQAIKAIETGIEMVEYAKEKGYRLIATGEMGIGNTTTSSAIGAVILQQPVENVTGVGAGLCSEGLQRKINAIKKAIELHQPDRNDPIDVLSKVGGLDIAGIAGLYIGGAVYGVPVMIDGVISSIAALLAAMISPKCADYMICSHVSKEPLGALLLEKLGKRPMLNCDMCLGEGTGAVAAMALLNVGLSVYNDMCTFEDTDIDQYMELK